MSEFDRDKYISSRLSRHEGANEDQRKYMAQELSKFTDWKATCRKCGVKLEGSLKDLKGHTCE